MTRLLAAPLLALALTAALVAYGVDGLRRLEVSHQLWIINNVVGDYHAANGSPEVLGPALVMARELVRLAPHQAEVHAAQGDLYLTLSRLEQADAAYRRALELTPRPELYFNLALVEHGKGQVSEARRLAKLAIRLDRMLEPRLPPGLRTIVSAPEP